MTEVSSFLRTRLMAMGDNVHTAHAASGFAEDLQKGAAALGLDAGLAATASANSDPVAAVSHRPVAGPAPVRGAHLTPVV